MDIKKRKTKQLSMKPIHRVSVFFLALMITIASMPSITARADDERTIELDLSCSYTALGDTTCINYNYFVTGSGKFVMVTYYNSMIDSDTKFHYSAYLLSDNNFVVSYYFNDSLVEVSPTKYNGVYYFSLRGTSFGGSFIDYCISLNGYANYRQSDEINYIDALKADIDAGYFDLSADDYLSDEALEDDALYYPDLDFSSISADYKAKFTIEKNSDGNWEFVTPSNAGIQFDWTNREDIDNAYVKFTLYGEFYESFWSASYTNTYVTLTCDRKNDLAYLCKQSEMLSLAESKLGVSSGYGFVVNYIYVQAFAKINGTMYRSRIYKFDADLVSDVGNAESEDDEYYPEITAGAALPSDYVPSSTNIDPEKTEPSADSSDDTLIATPVDGTSATIDNSSDLLDEFTDSSGAFSSFINVMSQGISLLGDFPSLVAAVFSYVPSYFLIFIGVGFAVAVVLRLMGR